MNSMERTMTAIGHQEPDRVPLFLLLSLYGAKEMQLPVRAYFSKPEHIVQAQLRMRAKYRNDCIYTFHYAAVEVEAFGGEVVFTVDGPPNSGEPLIRSLLDIDRLEVPVIRDCECLGRVLQATAMLKEQVGSEIPIIGVVMSPFSLPVMQMGFENYLNLIYGDPAAFNKLMRINEAFCVSWANAQLAAGATAICYFNPLASPNMIERERYLTTGYPVDKRTISRIRGATATHLASGIVLPVIDDIIRTGSAVIGFGTADDLAALKKAASGRICLMGNMNGIDMVNWDDRKAQSTVQNLVKKAGAGGGLILSDSHGEIPLQVPESVLMAISEAVSHYGTYPLGGDIE